MILNKMKVDLPWEKNPAYDDAGPIPDMLVGDTFIVAVPCNVMSNGAKNSAKNSFYDIQIIVADETGFNKDGESWGDWSWSDIEYYIPLDGKRNLSEEQP